MTVIPEMSPVPSRITSIWPADSKRLITGSTTIAPSTWPLWRAARPSGISMFTSWTSRMVRPCSAKIWVRSRWASVPIGTAMRAPKRPLDPACLA